MKRIVILLIFLLAAGCDAGGTGNDLTAAKNGVLELRDDGFGPGGMLPLDGEWVFAWHNYIMPGDTPGFSAFGEIVTIPSLWSQNTYRGKKLPSEGYASYRVVIKNLRAGQSLALRVPYMYSAYALYINGKLAAKNGILSDEASPGRPQFRYSHAFFESTESELELLIHVANRHDRKGGIWEAPILGTAETLTRYRDQRIALELFLSGILVIMGLYHLVIFLMRMKDRAPLFLSILCFSIACRNLFTGEIFITAALPDFPWALQGKIEYIMVYIALPVFLFFWRSVYSDVMPSVPALFVGAASSVLIGITAFCEKSVFAPLVLYFYPLLIVSLVFVAAVLVRAARKKKDGAVIALCGFSVFFLTIVADILRAEEIIGTPSMVPAGFFLFILFHAFILSLRSSRAFTVVEGMSERLLSVDRMKDEFLANTSHELKNPLHGIIGLTESVINRSADALKPEDGKDLATVVFSARRLAYLVNDLLDFSRLKNRDIALNRQAVDLRVAVDVAFDMMRPLIKGGDVELINSIPDDFTLLLADENRLQQILHNIIGNAVKFTAEGRISVSAETDRDAGGEGFAVITVSDTGRGIPEGMHERIFEPFEQCGADREGYGGAGIGLSITSYLVNMHGGKMRAFANVNGGASIEFSLPVFNHNRNADSTSPLFQKGENAVERLREFSERSAEKNIDHDESEYHKDTLTDSRRILSVDDDPVNNRVISNLLSGEKYSVLTASGGSEALSIIGREERIDLVLLDIMMPGMSGYQVLRSIREKYSMLELPVILLSVRSGEMDIVTGLREGANDYIVKPFSSPELLSRVGTFLKMKELLESEGRLKRLEAELDVARKIQSMTLPPEFPVMEGMAVSARYIPAKIIGGDFYDFIRTPGEGLGVLIADVTGNGVPAALIASMIKVVYGFHGETAPAPGNLVSGMNRMLMGYIGSRYCTAAAVFLDRKRMLCRYARAGHEPLMHYSARTGAVNEYIPRGPIIGISRESVFETVEIPVETGDRLFLYTDGITELRSPSGEMFGSERLADCIVENRGSSMEMFIDALLERLAGWSGEENFEDDIAIVVIDVLQYDT